MAPMISTADEAARFATLCAAAGLKTPGVMVEVPSAALTAATVLREVSFASRTNDLTQYAMAADRQLGPLATLNDPWQPAVLQLVKLTADGAARSAAKPARQSRLASAVRQQRTRPSPSYSLDLAWRRCQ